MRVLYVQPWNTSSYEDAVRMRDSLEGAMLPRAMFEVGWLLAQAGAKIDFLDCNIIAFSEPTRAQCAIELALAGLMKNTTAQDAPYDAVFLSWPTVAQGNIVRHLASEVRSLTRAPIIVGGGAISLVKDDVFRLMPADIFYDGDGVEIVEMLVRIAQKQPCIGIPGVVIHGGYPRARRKLPDNYSAERFYSVNGQFDFPAYLAQYRSAGVEPFGLLEMMRGCPYRCTYCAIRGELVGVRYRSSATVAEEAEFLCAHGVRNFYVIDPTLGLHKKRTDELLERFSALKSQRAEFKWWGITRCDRITAEFAAKLRAAGAHTMSIGVETMNAGKLARVQKRSVPEKSAVAARILKSAGITARLLLMHFPDTHDTETLQFLESAEKDDIRFIVQSSMLRSLWKCGDGARDFRKWDQECDGREAGLDTNASILGWLLANLAFSSTNVNRTRGDSALRRRLTKIDTELWFKAVSISGLGFSRGEREALGFLRVGYSISEVKRKRGIKSRIVDAVIEKLRLHDPYQTTVKTIWLGIVASTRRSRERWYYYPVSTQPFPQLGFGIKVGRYLDDLDALIHDDAEE